MTHSLWGYKFWKVVTCLTLLLVYGEAAPRWGTLSILVALAGLNRLDSILLLAPGLAFLILVPRWRSRTAIRQLFRRDLFLIAIPNSLAFILQFKAQELTTASKAALFVNSAPIWVVLISAFFLKEGVTRRQFLAMLVALAGVVTVSTRLDFSDFSVINVGDLMCMATGLAWAVFIVFSTKIVRRYGPFDLAQALYLWAAVFGFPFIFSEPTRFEWAATPAVLYLAIFTTVIAYIFYLKGVQSVSPVATSIVILIEVVVAFLIASTFLGESFSTVETIGVILVMGGVVLVIGGPQNTAPPEAPKST